MTFAALALEGSLPTVNGFTLDFVFAAAACGLATLASIAVPKTRASRRANATAPVYDAA